eukprot:6440694-Pyramimonas_sp.AAC.1
MQTTYASLAGCLAVDVKGNRVDIKGSRVDVKGNSVDVKGNSCPNVVSRPPSVRSAGSTLQLSTLLPQRDIASSGRGLLGVEKRTHLILTEVTRAPVEVHLPGEQHHHLKQLCRGPRDVACALACPAGQAGRTGSQSNKKNNLY